VRVLLVNDYGTPTGGAELQTLRFRDLLRERGHEATLLTSDARPHGAELGSDVTCTGTQGAGRAVLQAVNPWAAVRLRTLLRSFRPDVVHLRMFMSQLSPLVLRELRGVPTLMHAVNYQLICPLNTKLLPDGTSCAHRAGAVCVTTGCVSSAGRLRFAMQRRMWQAWGDAVDVSVANSRWTAARLANDGLPLDGNFTYGVPELGRRGPLADTPVVAFVGRLFRKKGVDVLLRAMALVRRAVPGAHLRIVGDGPERAALERLAEELSLGPDAVSWHGFVRRDRLDALLGDAWLQAVPSVYEEPFGVVTIEAMMRGTALVASNTGGPSEVVREGETGYLVPPGDPALLAEAMCRALRDRALAEQLGAAAYEIARREFTESASMDRLLALYQQTVERFRAKGRATS
jgi:glycosyltransferase involved in cell wall biosynthesis